MSLLYTQIQHTYTHTHTTPPHIYLIFTWWIGLFTYLLNWLFFTFADAYNGSHHFQALPCAVSPSLLGTFSPLYVPFPYSLLGCGDQRKNVTWAAWGGAMTNCQAMGQGRTSWRRESVRTEKGKNEEINFAQNCAKDTGRWGRKLWGGARGPCLWWQSHMQIPDNADQHNTTLP